MILSEPGRTSYDLNFSIFGFHVRVHPLFFVLPVLLGHRAISPEVSTGIGLLVIIAIFFVSILVHELGHAIAFRYYGLPARIVLYWMGGIAIPDSGGSRFSRPSRSLTSNQQIVVTLAGPLSGLMIAVLLALIVYGVGGTMVISDRMLFPIPVPKFTGTIFETRYLLQMVFFIGILLNVFMNLLNLLPIYPLDGGQVARQIMIQMDGYHGVRNSIYLSMGVSLLLAVFFLVGVGDQFLAIFFAYMTWSSYQSLQQHQRPRW